jgi:phenylacetate-coenzyme A ligase PaaK-like adenylate-forming protein
MKFHTPKESFRWLKALWEHRRNSRMSRSQLEAQQLRKFRELVAFAETHSPYYRSIIQERGIDARTCVPTDFPVLTKQDVLNYFDDIVTDRQVTKRGITDFLARSTNPMELYQGRYHVLHTSGSSGTIGCFVYSHDAWIKGASQVVQTSPLGLRRRVAYVGVTRGHFAGVSMMSAGNDGTNALFYNIRAFDVGQPTAQIVEQLNEFQPKVLSGYPRMLKVLAEAQERGDLRIHLEEVGSGGEPLLPDTRAYVERIFQAPLKNSYASSEHLYMAFPLPKARGLHLLEDDLIFELTPDHTCVTNLFNPTMPLIRYRMEDVLVPDTSAPSPYPFTRIRDIIGRYEDTLEFINELGVEDFIHPIVIVELVVKGLNSWQLVLEGPTSFRFRACFESGLSELQREQTRVEIARKLDAILAEKHMGNVRYEIEEVDAVVSDPKTGKFRLVVREYVRSKPLEVAA